MFGKRISVPMVRDGADGLPVFYHNYKYVWRNQLMYNDGPDERPFPSDPATIALLQRALQIAHSPDEEPEKAAAAPPGPFVGAGLPGFMVQATMQSLRDRWGMEEMEELP